MGHGAFLAIPENIIVHRIFFKRMVLQHSALLEIPGGGSGERRKHAVFQISQLRNIVFFRQAIHKLHPMRQMAFALGCAHVIVAEEIVSAVIRGDDLGLFVILADKRLLHFASSFPFQIRI